MDARSGASSGGHWGWGWRGSGGWGSYGGGWGNGWRYDGNGGGGAPRDDMDHKEFVPAWDGKSEPLKTYRRRVAIYMSNLVEMFQNTSSGSVKL